MTVTVYPLTVGTVSDNDDGFAGAFRAPWTFADSAAAAGDVVNLFGGTGWSENTDYDHPLIAEGASAGFSFMWVNRWGTIAGLPASLPPGTTSVELRMAGGVSWNPSGAIASGDYARFRFAVYPQGGALESILAVRTTGLGLPETGLFVTGLGTVASPDDNGEIWDTTVPLDYGGDWSTFELNFGAEVSLGFAVDPSNMRVYSYESALTLELIVTHDDTPPPVGPTAAITVTPSTTGTTATMFTFSSADSTPGDTAIVTRAWDFGDGTTGTGTSLPVTYASPGTYTVTLTVTDANDLTDTDTIEITVSGDGGETTEPFTFTLEGDCADCCGPISTGLTGTVPEFDVVWSAARGLASVILSAVVTFNEVPGISFFSIDGSVLDLPPPANVPSCYLGVGVGNIAPTRLAGSTLSVSSTDADGLVMTGTNIAAGTVYQFDFTVPLPAACDNIFAAMAIAPTEGELAAADYRYAFTAASSCDSFCADPIECPLCVGTVEAANGSYFGGPIIEPPAGNFEDITAATPGWEEPGESSLTADYMKGVIVPIDVGEGCAASVTATFQVEGTSSIVCGERADFVGDMVNGATDGVTDYDGPDLTAGGAFTPEGWTYVTTFADGTRGVTVPIVISNTADCTDIEITASLDYTYNRGASAGELLALFLQQDDQPFIASDQMPEVVGSVTSGTLSVTGALADIPDDLSIYGNARVVILVASDDGEFNISNLTVTASACCSGGTYDVEETRDAIDIGAVTPGGQPLNEFSDLTADGGYAVFFDNPPTGYFSGLAWTIPPVAPAPGYRVIGARVEGLYANVGSVANAKGEFGFVDGVGGFVPGFAQAFGADSSAWTQYPGQAGVLATGLPDGGSITFVLDTPYEAGTPAPAALVYFASSLNGLDYTLPYSAEVGKVTWVWAKDQGEGGYAVLIDESGVPTDGVELEVTNTTQTVSLSGIINSPGFIAIALDSTETDWSVHSLDVDVTLCCEEPVDPGPEPTYDSCTPAPDYIMDALRDILRNSHRVTTRIKVAVGDGGYLSFCSPLWRDTPWLISRGEIKESLDDEITRTLTAELVADYWSNTEEILSDLSPYKTMIRVERGIYTQYGIVYVPLGVYRLFDVNISNGRLASITAFSQEADVRDHRFIAPPGVTAAPQTFEALLSPSGPILSDMGAQAFIVNWLGPGMDSIEGKLKILPAKTTLTTGRNRLELIKRLAEAVGADFYFDRLNLPVVKKKPTFEDAVALVVNAQQASSPPGELPAILVSFNKKYSRNRVYNAVVVTSSDTAGTTTFRGVAYDTEPASPTRWGGPFGKKPRFYSSPFFKSDAECLATAVRILNESFRLKSSLDFSMVPNPLVQLGDVLELIYPDGASEKHIVRTLTIGLSADAEMTSGTAADSDTQAEMSSM